MAFQAEGSEVCEIALAAAFDHRNDMIGIPKAFSGSRSGTKAPIDPGLQAGGSAQSLQMSPGRQAIDAALTADALVALEHSLADVSGIGAQAPFLDAPVRTECEAALGYL
jgi:hypothetical protein